MNTSPLKIFSDQRFVGNLNLPWIPLLYPFWGLPGVSFYNPCLSSAPEFKTYLKTGRNYFRLVSLEEAQMAVFPIPWEIVVDSPSLMSRAKLFIEKVSQDGKSTLIFFWDDGMTPVDLPKTCVFRTSLDPSQKTASEFAFPPWIVDFPSRYLKGTIPWRIKSEKPVVGFCGQVSPSDAVLHQVAKKLIGKRKIENRKKFSTLTHSGFSLRRQAMKLLSENPCIQTNFLVREDYFGGVLCSDVDTSLLEKVRQEYFYNMLESDYVLCVAGLGNFSYRFYEALSCGRIPVFVNTDCVLPYDFIIDWKKYIVWVEESEIDTLDQKLLEFHEALSPKTFVQTQQQCRRLWEKWLSPHGFFSHFSLHFMEREQDEP